MGHIRDTFYMLKAKEIFSKRFKGISYRILKDGSKTFFMRYHDPITGQRKRIKVGNSKEGMNEAYCANKRSELLSKLRLGEDPNIPILKKKQTKETLNDLAEKYFTHKRLEGETRSYKERYSKYNHHFSAGLGLIPLQSITKQNGLDFQKQLLNSGYANSTINNILELATSIFNYGINEEFFTGTNPFHGIKGLAVNNDRQRYLTHEEIEQLKDEVRHDRVLYLFVLLSVTTGARLESVLAMQKKDIDFAQSSIRINDLKNKNTYAGFLADEVKNILLEETQSLLKDDFIVSYENGKRMEKKRIQRRLSPILNRLFNQELKEDDRINKVVIHTLRHTFASLLAIKGTPIYTIQKLMNHKDIKQTTRYAKLSPSSGLSAVADTFN